MGILGSEYMKERTGVWLHLPIKSLSIYICWTKGSQLVAGAEGRWGRRLWEGLWTKVGIRIHFMNGDFNCLSDLLVRRNKHTTARIAGREGELGLHLIEDHYQLWSREGIVGFWLLSTITILGGKGLWVIYYFWSAGGIMQRYCPW